MKIFDDVKKINWLKIMKISCTQLLFILLFAGVSYAHPTAAQINLQQKINMDIGHTSIAEALNKLEKITNVKFVYSPNVVDVSKPVAISVTDASLETILNNLLTKNGIDYDVINDRIVLSASPDKPVKSTEWINPKIEKKWFPINSAIDIDGTVKDENGNPLIGVTILVKGTDIGTVTDGKGNFSLQVSESNLTLVVSYVGYNTKEVPVHGAGHIDIVLEPSATGLHAVTVTALGIKRESKALGYSVQKVEGSNLQTVEGVDIGTSLTGQVAGLVVKNSTEFNTPPTLQLRGESALLVIDGVPYENMTLRDIPTDNIQSIDVLKGATASALYGARGANGAIMITTKTGEGKGLTVDFNSNTMLTLGYIAIPKVQTNYGHGENGQIYTDYVWGPRLNIGDSAIQWNPVTKQNEMMPLITRGKDNLGNFMNVGVVTNNSISVTQSGKLGYFRAGVNYIYNKGQFPNENLKIINYTMDGKITAGKKFSIESHMGYNRQTSPQNWGEGYYTQGYLYQLDVWTGPDYDIRQYKDYWVTPNVQQNWLYKAWYDNPYMIAYQKLQGTVDNKLNASLTANYNFTPDLNLMFRSGYDYYSNELSVQNPPNINSTRGTGYFRIHPGSSDDYDTYNFYWNWGGKGLYGQDKMWGFSTNNDLILTYNKNIDKWTFNGLAGGSINYYIDQELGSQTVNGLSIPGWYSFANATPSTTVGQNSISTTYGTWAKQVNSLYGKLSLGWNQAVYLDVTGRNDWSSTQPTSQRSYFYPSVSTSIILSQFLHLPQYVNMWRIRGAWTVDKNMSSIYADNRTYSVGTLWGLSASSYPGNLQPLDLLPSSSRSWEFGTAAYLFNDRLHIDATYFSKLYYDQQQSVTVSSASGFSSTLVNTNATYARRGVEITVDGSIIKNRNFEWHSTINYSFNHRYWVTLDSTYSPDDLYHKKGERLDDYVIYDWERDPNGNIININGLPVESQYSSKIGYGDPDFSFGFINNFNIGNFTIGVNIDGRIGGLMYDYIWDEMFATGASPETDNQWRYDQVVKGLTNYVGPGVKVVSGSVTYDKYGRITSDTRQYAPNDVAVGYQAYEQWISGGGNHGIMNESFAKLRQVSIGYRIPPKFFGKRNTIRSASISITGQNLLLITGFKYSDPDIDTEDLNAPSQRMVGLDIKLGF